MVCIFDFGMAREAYLKLHHISRDKDALVGAHLQIRNDQVHRRLDFLRAVQDWKLESTASFLDLLYSTKVRGSGADTMVWICSPQKALRLVCFIKFFSDQGVAPFRGKLFGSLKYPQGSLSLFGSRPLEKY